MMRALDGLQGLSSALESRGIGEARKESELILSERLGIDRVELYRDNPALFPWQEDELMKVSERRSAREPVQYIIGHVEFFGLKIGVGPGVLIPRPETELIVEEAMKVVANRRLPVAREDRGSDPKLETRNLEPATQNSPLRILDLCTGSGCLALALAKSLPDAQVLGTDISGKALEYAEKNAADNEIRNVSFLKGDLYEPVEGMKFDIIVSNPPYIRGSEIENLQPEIRGWEPIDALDGGEDGLAFYRRIFSRAGNHLDRGGCIIVEMGEGASDQVRRIAEGSGYRSISVVRDYSGIERHLLCQ